MKKHILLSILVFSVMLICVLPQLVLGKVEKAPVKLDWKCVESNQSHYVHIHRAKVPGGWLIRYDKGGGVAGFFYPDPKHEWGKKLGDKKSGE